MFARRNFDNRKWQLTTRSRIDPVQASPATSRRELQQYASIRLSNMLQQYLSKVWNENPSYIRRYYDNLKTNEKLCQEVSYILSVEIEKAKIEIAQISSRTKSLESFCEKISRKGYQNPFNDVTDFAGVRVVYLYSASRPYIERIIEREFEIVEKVDKNISDEDRFGYGALHYIVKIRNSHAGARYDELKNMICEIQVRTILQDAWALVAHHLSYKQESDAPQELRRKLNALSGLFETADDQFETIRNFRRTYQDKLQKTILTGNSLNNIEEANIDSLEAYLKSRFPERDHHGRNGVAELLDDLKNHELMTLSDIDTMINAVIDAVLAEEAKYPPSNEDQVEALYSTIGLVRTALVFTSEEYLKNTFGNKRITQIKEFKHLIKK